jgi:hypothetical protein
VYEPTNALLLLLMYFHYIFTDMFRPVIRPELRILVTDLFCPLGFMQIFMRILRLKTEIVCIAVIRFLNTIISTHSIVILILQSNEHKKTVSRLYRLKRVTMQICMTELIKKKQ